MECLKAEISRLYDRVRTGDHKSELALNKMVSEHGTKGQEILKTTIREKRIREQILTEYGYYKVD